MTVSLFLLFITTWTLLVQNAGSSEDHKDHGCVGVSNNNNTAYTLTLMNPGSNFLYGLPIG
jgi:hypothetical protein